MLGKVWRFPQKHKDVFTLYRLPGSLGCLVFNTSCPCDTGISLPSDQQIADVLGKIREYSAFSVGYNILLAARMFGADVDYHLVWNMGHGSDEGSSTGTFIDWINTICAA